VTSLSAVDLGPVAISVPFDPVKREVGLDWPAEAETPPLQEIDWTGIYMRRAG
jgi:hypothetical protein